MSERGVGICDFTHSREGGTIMRKFNQHPKDRWVPLPALSSVPPSPLSLVYVAQRVPFDLSLDVSNGRLCNLLKLIQYSLRTCPKHLNRKSK